MSDNGFRLVVEGKSDNDLITLANWLREDLKRIDSDMEVTSFKIEGDRG